MARPSTNIFLLACISSFLVFSLFFFLHDWFLFSISFVLFFIFCFVKCFDFDFAVVLPYFQKCILGGEIVFILFLLLFLFNFCLSFSFLFYFSSHSNLSSWLLLSDIYIISIVKSSICYFSSSYNEWLIRTYLVSWKFINLV